MRRLYRFILLCTMLTQLCLVSAYGDQITPFSWAPWISGSNAILSQGAYFSDPSGIEGLLLVGSSPQRREQTWGTAIVGFEAGPIKTVAGCAFAPPLLSAFSVEIPPAPFASFYFPFSLGNQEIGLGFSALFIPRISGTLEGQDFQIQSLPLSSVSVGTEFGVFSASLVSAYANASASIERVSVGSADALFIGGAAGTRQAGLFGGWLQGTMDFSAVAGLFGYTVFSAQGSADMGIPLAGAYWNVQRKGRRFSISCAGAAGAAIAGTFDFVFQTIESSRVSTWSHPDSTGTDCFALLYASASFTPSSRLSITPFRLIGRFPSTLFSVVEESSQNPSGGDSQSIDDIFGDLDPATLLFAGTGLSVSFSW